MDCVGYGIGMDVVVFMGFLFECTVTGFSSTPRLDPDFDEN
jgi:hypothetical protein